jgi:hypothetical protein
MRIVRLSGVGVMLARQNLVQPARAKFQAAAPISQCNKFNALQHDWRFWVAREERRKGGAARPSPLVGPEGRARRVTRPGWWIGAQRRDG